MHAPLHEKAEFRPALLISIPEITSDRELKAVHFQRWQSEPKRKASHIKGHSD